MPRSLKRCVIWSTMFGPVLRSSHQEVRRSMSSWLQTPSVAASTSSPAKIQLLQNGGKHVITQNTPTAKWRETCHYPEYTCCKMAGKMLLPRIQLLQNGRENNITQNTPAAKWWETYHYPEYSCCNIAGNKSPAVSCTNRKNLTKNNCY